MLWYLASLALAGAPVVVPLGGPAGPNGIGPRGAAIQPRAEIDGVPVEGGATVRLDAAGQIRGIYGRDLPITRVDGPALPAADAIARALRVAPGTDPRARLSWQARGGVLRRVWTVELRRPAGRVGVRIDAVTGAVLDVYDAAPHAAGPPLARAYVHNPVIDGEPAEFPLPLATEALSDARVELRQCRDLGEIRTYELESGDWDLHICTEVPAALPIDGNYLYDPVPYAADPGRDEDDFAAPHTYWNVHEGLAWFDALGWVPVADFVDPRLIVTVNMRDTDLSTVESAADPAGALEPYDNAYSTGGYLDWEDVWVPPELVFGQGTAVDFAYDADVIHHELGHYIVKSQAGPSWSEDTSYGPSYRASALNEAFADYFSSAIHGDPALAEYAGGGGAIRDLSGDATCATDLYGQQHYDGRVFAQAMWQAREGLAADARASFDAIALDSLALMGINADFPDAAAVIEDLVAERLGAATAADISAIFDGRGLHDCPPIVDVTPGTAAFRSYSAVPGAYRYSTAGEVPGFVQLRVDVPEGGAKLTLTFDQAEAREIDLYGDNVPFPLDVIGRSGDRLTWEKGEATMETSFSGYELTFEVEDWISDGGTVATAEEIGTSTTDDVIWHSYAATWDVTEPGPYTFQLANIHERSAVAYALTLGLEPLSDIAPDDTDAIADADADDDEKGGCGCASTGSSAGGAWVLAALVVVARRRTGQTVR